MLSTFNFLHKNRELGFSEILLLLFLTLALINIDSLWTLNKAKLYREQTMGQVLKEDRQDKQALFTLLENDPYLTNFPIINQGLKSSLKLAGSRYKFSIENKNPMLNWSLLQSMQFNSLPCTNNTLQTSNAYCDLNTHLLSSNEIAAFTYTHIKELRIKPLNTKPIFVSLGELSIDSLIIEPSNESSYIVIAAYNNITINTVSSSISSSNSNSNKLPQNTKLLVYSILGQIEVKDLNTNTPCLGLNNGSIVFIGNFIKVSGQQANVLGSPTKSCLKDFPNQLFTSIKIASIH